jgi:hypothetical protein
MVGPLQRPLPDNTQHSQRYTHPCLMAGFEPAIPLSERPQTHASDRAAAGICYQPYSHSYESANDKLKKKICMSLADRKEKYTNVFT